MSTRSDQIKLFKEFPLFAPNEDFSVWEGYLSAENPPLKIKLWTPHFPDLKKFSFECSPLMKICLTSQLETLKNCKTLSGLLYSIMHIVKTKLPSILVNEPIWDTKSIKSTHTLLCELEAVVEKKNILKIGDNFRDIKVKHRDSEGNDHILMFRIPPDYPKGYISILEADLPSEVLATLSKISSIKFLYDLFKESVESLLPFWNICRILEGKTWVVDPSNPQKKDVFRRIILNDDLSVMLTFDPLKPSICPDLKFLGSMKAVAAARAKYLKNIDVLGWDEDLDVVDNISQLLEIPLLPVKPEAGAGNENNDNECYICFTYIIDNEEPPSKLCSNSNCSSWYHYLCLVQWLESVVSSVRMYDHIAGPCPYCNEKIWCPLRNEAS